MQNGSNEMYREQGKITNKKKRRKRKRKGKKQRKAREEEEEEEERKVEGLVVEGEICQAALVVVQLSSSQRKQRKARKKVRWRSSGAKPKTDSLRPGTV